jgi:hypothetical protein
MQEKSMRSPYLGCVRIELSSVGFLGVQPQQTRDQETTAEDDDASLSTFHTIHPNISRMSELEKFC